MKSLWIPKTINYDGSQLRSLFAYLDYGLQGDSIVAWQGGCDIPFEKMVDGEDRVAAAEICGSQMLHFIVEAFHEPLSFGVAFQRLFASIVIDALKEFSPQKEMLASLYREGDDIYLGEGEERKKLSISIATVSPVSTLIHFAVNISNEGTPVATLSLEDLDVEVIAFAKRVMECAVEEFESVKVATQKVLWVK